MTNETARRDRWIEWMECIDTAIDRIRDLDLPNAKKGEIMDLLFTDPSPTKESK